MRDLPSRIPRLSNQQGVENTARTGPSTIDAHHRPDSLVVGRPGQEDGEDSPARAFEIPERWALSLNSRDNQRVALPRRQQQILPLGPAPVVLSLSSPSRLPRPILRTANSLSERSLLPTRTSGTVVSRHGRSYNTSFERRQGRQAILFPPSMDLPASPQAPAASSSNGRVGRVRDATLNQASDINGLRRQAATLPPPRDARRLVAANEWYPSDEPAEALEHPINDENENRGYQGPSPSPSPTPTPPAPPRRTRRTVLAAIDVPEGYHPYNDVPLNLAAAQIRYQPFFEAGDQPSRLNGDQPYPAMPLDVNAALARLLQAHQQPHPSFFASLEDGGVHRELERIVDNEGAIVDGDAPPLYTEVAERDGADDGYEDLPPAYVEVDVRIRVPVGAGGAGTPAVGATRGVTSDIVIVEDTAAAEASGGEVRSASEQVKLEKKKSGLGGKLWKGMKDFLGRIESPIKVVMEEGFYESPCGGR